MARISLRFRVLVASLLLVCFVASFGVSQSRRPKNVQVSLRAKWAGTPLLLEAGELLSKEQKNVFWDFVDMWVPPEKGSDCVSAKCCVLKIVEDAQSLLSESLLSIFLSSLMLRTASPRLVLYRELADNSLTSFSSTNETSKLETSASTSSCCWVDIGNKRLFGVPDLISWVVGLNQVDIDLSDQPELFYFDHVHPGSKSYSRPIAILYGAVGIECFKEFHSFLKEASKMGKIKYVLRPVFLPWCQNKASTCSLIGALDPVTLSGYGVELALKNMEYKAMDDTTVKKGLTPEDPKAEDLNQENRGFIFSKLLERKPEHATEIMEFRDYLLLSAESDTLEVWELKDLGHQTAQKIVQASDPLQSMQDINQNFPSIVSSISRMKLNNSVKNEILSNQQKVPPGKSLMALNGALINIEDIDIYLLMDLVHEDLSLADQISKLKLPQSTIQKLLSAPPPSDSNLFRMDFRSSHVHYLNNLEEDSMYRRWDSNINKILMPVFPGQLRYIRKNMFHAVYVLDPTLPCSVETIDAILSLYENSVPMRFGVILYSSKIIDAMERNSGNVPTSLERNGAPVEDVSSLILSLFLYIKETYSTQLAFQFLSQVNQIRSSGDNSGVDLLEALHVKGAFVETLLSKTKIPPQDLLLKLEKENKYKDEVDRSSQFVFKLGLYKLHCCLLMNGLVYEPTEDSTLNAMNEELPRIQEQVYYGHIHSDTDILDKLFSENSYKRYNPSIADVGKGNEKFVSLSPIYLDNESVLHEVDYLHSPGTLDELKPTTHLLVVDISSHVGIKLMHESILYLIDGSKQSRVGLLIYASDDVSPFFLLLREIVTSTASAFSGKEKALNFLHELCSLYERYDTSDGLYIIMETVYGIARENDLPVDHFKALFLDFSVDKALVKIKKVSNFLFGQVGIQFGANGVITNGRIFILNNKDPFLKYDMFLLDAVEYLRTRPSLEIIEGVEWAETDLSPDELTSQFYSDLTMVVSSAMALRERSSERARFEILNSDHSAVILNNPNATIHIDAIIDPLSPMGQKLSPLLSVLWKMFQPSMRIILNPISSLADLPLKSYYRFVLPSLDDYSLVDYSAKGPKAFFANMPQSKTLTMNIDIPEPWLVEPVVAIHDLDNILLENLGDVRTLQAVFELEALLLTGHCTEKDRDPPRGLQLILGTKERPHLVDTIVMANLGYWQMKVTPGVWYLQLATGRSSELYMIKETAEESLIYHSSKLVAIDSLRGKLLHIEVEKHKGKESEDLLLTTEETEIRERRTEEDSSWNKNILKWASGLIGGDGSRKQNDTKIQRMGKQGETINIFSVASGHLYERFLKIMILSVLKNTQRPVKFWFIKNYLSPPFKDVIPRMAEEYGFEYELVTYKWPTWLHKQTEKQRIIWAYKILFLDVIFPLSLKKVIFVDADQVVRADMGELYDMDLKGKPLAYTPFCDNNKEMDGYRFWKQGFWKDHLRGKPYHISALYVVDLARFRQTAAGDNLRVFYESLSRDPNSLSNLDQDLPNYAQHMVPIFSLPQEWLWCESWCGDGTKSRAKTIDLCNNPMTKEPKLQGAKRIVPEWVSLDTEARQFTARILGEQVGPQDATPSSFPDVPKSSSEDDLEFRSEL